MNRHTAGVFFLTGMLVLVLALGLGTFFVVRSIKNSRNTLDGTEEFSLIPSAEKKQEAQDTVSRTVFVLEDEEHVYFTEVLVYYAEFNRGFVVDIPGNTGAIYTSLNRVDRIDAVYREKGIESFREEIAKILGFSDSSNDLNYIEMSADRFKELTDILGGLKVFVPLPVDIVNGDGERWLLPSGAVSLDGDKAYTYLTYEDKDEKYESVADRRKNIIVAFLTALTRNAKRLENDRHFNLFAERMNSNLDEDALRDFIRDLSAGDFEGLKPVSINGKQRHVEGVEGKLLFPEFDGQDIKRVVKLKTTALISSAGENLSRVYVLEIQNGTKVTGLAHNTAIYYRGAGYDVFNVTNADKDDYEKTVIINHIGDAEIAKGIGSYIRCNNIVEEKVSEDSDSKSNVDFTIILGKDFDGRYVR